MNDVKASHPKRSPQDRLDAGAVEYLKYINREAADTGLEGFPLSVFNQGQTYESLLNEAEFRKIVNHDLKAQGRPPVYLELFPVPLPDNTGS